MLEGLPILAVHLWDRLSCSHLKVKNILVLKKNLQGENFEYSGALDVARLPTPRISFSMLRKRQCGFSEE